MKLIIGGAFQGKLDFAKTAYHLSEDDVFTCTGTEIDFSKPCIASIEEFTYACVTGHVDAKAYFEAHEDRWKDSVLICQDIFCGVVPLGADQRAWRNETGILCQYLSRKAESISRIFCGMEQKIK